MGSGTGDLIQGADPAATGCGKADQQPVAYPVLRARRNDEKSYVGEWIPDRRVRMAVGEG
jgi:hypothetical protein